MTGRNGSQRKGLFAGFLTGSAVALSLGAAASYVSPLDGQPDAPSEPAVATTDIEPNAPKDVTAEVAIITPKSDSQRDLDNAPDNEAPEVDRDDANVAASIREATDPIQTETPQIEAPTAVDKVDAQTGVAADVAPKIPEAAPLTTSETAPEETVAEVDVSPGVAVKDAPVSEETNLETPEEDAPISLALNAPKVETVDKDDAPELPQVSEDAVEKPEIESEALEPKADEAASKPSVPTVPVVPVAPKAEPVIALSKPVQTPMRTAPTVAPAKPEPDVDKAESDTTQRSDEPVLAAPEVGETTPNAPKAEPQSEATTTAPQQVERPTVDAEPEAPVIEQASVAPEPKEPEPEPATEPEEEPSTDDTSEDKSEAKPAEQAEVETPKADENQVVDRRNPAPPSFEGRAFDAFAVKFIPPNNKPFLTIILEHVGEGSVNMYDLLDIGQPITFGVNSADELAKWRENEFRRGGFEVVALVPGDEGAGLSENMQDNAVSERLDTYLTAVPGAVAILDAVGSDLYRNPRKVSRVAEELNTSGRGLLVHEKFGVNRALEAARSAETPAASLVRVIDAQRDAASIRRALDKASLDASKTGASIVFGRTYPETIAAILPWLLGNSARSVTLAPLTSTMKRMVE